MMRDMAFEFNETSIQGLTMISPFYMEDQRGYFSKIFEKDIWQKNGISLSPHEELLSCSKKGVIRALHFQKRFSQDKLVRVLSGSVYDVAVDLRKDSPTFGQWQGFYLSAENRQMLYIPKGFAHGFLAIEENTLFSYLCGDRYDPESDGGIRWDDPDIGVEWPLDLVGDVIISDKDRVLPSFVDFCRDFGGVDV